MLSRIQRALGNPYLWGGLAALVAVGVASLFLFDSFLMPGYTRHDARIAVPDVMELPVEEAARQLAEQGLDAETQVQQFDPDLPRDVVIEQMPQPNEQVKPGRRIYLTVNSGETPRVTVPSVRDLSIREAKNRIRAVGLEIGDVRPDSIPAPYPDTVTRQDPESGTVLDEGQAVRIWYSQGLGSSYVTLPDVTGLSVQKAQQQLLDQQLRSEVVGAGDRSAEQLKESEVVRQSRQPGDRLQAGSVIRLYLD